MFFHLRTGDATRQMVIRVASSCSNYEDSISEDTVAIALDFSAHPTSHSINAVEYLLYTSVRTLPVNKAKKVSALLEVLRGNGQVVGLILSNM